MKIVTAEWLIGISLALIWYWNGGGIVSHDRHLHNPETNYVDSYAYNEDPPADFITNLDLRCPDRLPGSRVTFTDVLNDVDRHDAPDKPELLCNLYMNDGVEHYDILRKVELKQHGGAARRGKIKSFTATFLPGEPLWRGLNKLVLKKDPSDKSGLRSKILFDTFKEVPHFNSIRTNFMALNIHVSDEDTGEGADHDFGLYVNFEPVDENFVKRRNWLGVERYSLYQSASWDGSNSDIKMKSDPKYNETDFRDTLTFDGDDDHSAVVTMMQEIQTASDAEFPARLRKWFDLDNLATWVAITHGILRDWDHRSNNMGLFTNDRLGKFYFQPWDYDKSLRSAPLHSHMDVSMSNLHDHYLFRRILYTMPIEFMDLVWDKIVILTAENGPFSMARMQEKAARYSSVTDPYFQPGSVDATQLMKKPWHEFEDDFFMYLHNNKRWWKFNSVHPTSITMEPAKTNSLVMDTGDQKFYVEFKAAISPQGLDVEHQVVVHMDYDPQVTQRYETPRDIIWRSSWLNFGHEVSSSLVAFTVPKKTLTKCRKNIPGIECWINIHARDSEGNAGYYAQVPLYMGARRLFDSVEDSQAYDVKHSLVESMDE